MRMPPILCRVCRYFVPLPAVVAGVRTVVYHCFQGVPRAGTRTRCPVFMREPGADEKEPFFLRIAGEAT